MAALEVIALDTSVPQLMAPQAGDTYTFPRAVEMPLNTANGVLYLNGSKVVTSGSALTFDGTNLGVGASPIGGIKAYFATQAGNNTVRLDCGPGGSFTSDLTFGAYGFGAVVGLRFEDANALLRMYADATRALAFNADGSEQMRLTSTGLGIGTTPGRKLDVAGNGRVTGGNGIFFEWNNGTDATYVSQETAAEFRINQSTASANSKITFLTQGTLRATLDSSGNLGLGVTPSAWASTTKAIQTQAGSLYAQGSGFLILGQNVYGDATNDIYIANGAAARYYQNAGAHYWSTAPSGTAGNPISFSQALTLDANRNLLLNGTSAGASAVGTLAIFNGTAPTGSVTDGIILYAEDVSSSSELKVRDEAGNVTTLSPHNFSLIPEGPSEDMAWAYYSEKDGKRINVDMLKLARMVEKLTGEKLVYSA